MFFLPQTPSGVICPGRKDTKPLPTPATAFKFTSEILTPDSLTIGFIKVILKFILNNSDLRVFRNTEKAEEKIK